MSMTTVHHCTNYQYKLNQFLEIWERASLSFYYPSWELFSTLASSFIDCNKTILNSCEPNFAHFAPNSWWKTALRITARTFLCDFLFNFMPFVELRHAQLMELWPAFSTCSTLGRTVPQILGPFHFVSAFSNTAKAWNWWWPVSRFDLYLNG